MSQDDRIAPFAHRWDAGELAGWERTPQGYLRCDATITKAGVFNYRQPDGTVRRELRLPGEVFTPAAIESFGLSPLTNGHPPVMLNPSNTGRYQVGSVVAPRQDGDHLAATVQVTDSDAIEAIKGGRRELSCGYRMRLEMTSGVTSGVPGVPDGLRFDGIQRWITGNHVALVDKARGGDDLRLRLDAADALQIEPDGTDSTDNTGPSTGPNDGREPEGKPMESKITVDGVTYDVTDQVSQAVGKLSERIDSLTAELAEAKNTLSEKTAKLDAATDALDAEKQARVDAADDDGSKLREAVAARLKLERAAAPILGEETKLDELDDSAIKAAVVVAVARDKDAAKERVDGCDAAYLDARFDAALDVFEKDSQPNAGLAASRAAAADASRTDAADDARKRMIEHNRQVGRAALGKAEQ